MNNGKTILAQILAGLDGKEFQRCAKEFPTIRQTHALSPYDHFAAMVFAQLTYRDGLRDIEACLTGREGVLYHSGIRGRVTRSNLSYANEHRKWELFDSIATVLMRKAKQLYSTQFPLLDLDGDLFALDSTLIDLSLKLFPWAEKQPKEAAVKLNVLLDLNGDIPAFLSIRDGTCSDMRALDDLHIQPGAYYVLDRGYLDLKRLTKIGDEGASFITRPKRRMNWLVVESREVDRALGLRSDQIVVVNSKHGRRLYTKPFRRIRYKDPELNVSLVFLTNNLSLDAITVAQIYKNRWRIEIFFKWLKQNLKLRSFYSRSPNGVRIQVLCALCTYLLVAIARQRHRLSASMYQILQIVSICPLEKITLNELVAGFDTRNEQDDMQMSLAINGT